MQLVNRKAIVNGSNALILACCMGCSSAEPAQPGEGVSTTPASQEGDINDDNNPVLRMEVEAGHIVTVYEPTPGNLIMVESLQRLQRAILTDYDQPDAIEVFARLRPGEAVPEALLEAYERAQVSATLADAVPQPQPEPGQIHDPGGHPAMPASTVLEARSDGLGTIQQAHSQSHPADFVNNHAGCDFAPRWSICRVSWGGGFHSGSASGTSLTGVVDHFAGNGITVKLVANFATVSLAQAVGTIVVYNGGVGVVGNVPRHLEVLNATGDSFHVGTRVF